jgi:hypothetical protein
MKDTPTLFSLLVKLSPIERQKFGARRRELKKSAEERLVQDAKGEWRLEYWKSKKKIAELKIA